MQMFATKKTNSILLMENLTFEWIWNSFQTEGYDEMLLQIPGREPARGYYESQFSAAAQEHIAVQYFSVIWVGN